MLTLNKFQDEQKPLTVHHSANSSLLLSYKTIEFCHRSGLATVAP